RGSARQQPLLLAGELVIGENALLMELPELLEAFDGVRTDPRAGGRRGLRRRRLALEVPDALILVGLLRTRLRVAGTEGIRAPSHGRGAEERATSHKHLRPHPREGTARARP